MPADNNFRWAVINLAAAMPEHHCDRHVAERVRQRLEELGLEEKDLWRIGGHYVYLPHDERRPSLHNLLRYAVLLDLSPEFLAWGRGGKQLTPQMQESVLRLLGFERSGIQSAMRELRQARKDLHA